MVPERLEFGIFLAPFHHLGENPNLALRRDIELIARLDELGYDEAWVGEHHSAGWEIIASPEVFLAAAGENTTRIRLGTGVVSLPYHHPFHVADRIVLVDHLTRGRAMLGVGPGALPGDARILGLEATRQREMMDEALGIILQLLRGDEPVTYETDWFEMHDAQLQLRPYRTPLPVAVASTISPAGMSCAGKHGVGVLSIASYMEAGMAALPTQWGYCENAASQADCAPPDRRDWRIVAPMYLAETREEAVRDVEERILQWSNEYFVVTAPGGFGRQPAESGRQLIEQINAFGGVIGTPDDAIEKIHTLMERSGGFGCLLALAHEWAPQEKILHSYELLARHVMPEFQGSTAWTKRSMDWTLANREELGTRTQQAITKAFEKEGIDLAQQVQQMQQSRQKR